MAGRPTGRFTFAPCRARYQHTVEFRDPSWYDERVYELMWRYGVALCLHDMHGSASGTLAVGPFVYVRFHVGTRKYGGRYPDDRLDDWADWLAARAADGLHVFAYFNNDIGGHARATRYACAHGFRSASALIIPKAPCVCGQADLVREFASPGELGAGSWNFAAGKIHQPLCRHRRISRSRRRSTSSAASSNGSPRRPTRSSPR